MFSGRIFLPLLITCPGMMQFPAEPRGDILQDPGDFKSQKSPKRTAMNGRTVRPLVQVRSLYPCGRNARIAFYACGKKCYPPAPLRFLSNRPLPPRKGHAASARRQSRQQLCRCWARSWWAALRAAFFIRNNIDFAIPSKNF